MICVFNRMVSCETPKKCALCGWHPAVHAKRAEALRKRLAAEQSTDAVRPVEQSTQEDVWRYRA